MTGALLSDRTAKLSAHNIERTGHYICPHELEVDALKKETFKKK